MAVYLNKYGRIMAKAYLQMKPLLALTGFLILLGGVSPAFAAAASEVDDVARNIVESSSRLPGLISVMAYLLALLLGVTGVLKLKDHVSNPQQTPLKVAVIRFIAAGALLALPMIYEAMNNSISGGSTAGFDPNGTIGGVLSGLLGWTGSIPLNNVNNILSNIKDSLKDVPGLVSAAAYMLALLLGVTGIIKVKDHVENPDQTPLREGVTRFLAGGALFALPTVFNAMFSLIGNAGIANSITGLFGAFSMIFSSYGLNVCNPTSLLIGTSLGDSLCAVVFNAGAFPAFLTMIGYIIGLFVGVWGIVKIKDHVINPQQTSLWDGVSRLLAGGAFFALPVVVGVIRNSVTPQALLPFGSGIARTTFNETAVACDGSNGLDGALYCFMDDILTPAHVLLNFFSMTAGMILIMIGISRLMKGAQEGARGPGGLGTIMTFVTGGALLSYNEFVKAATATLSMGLIPGAPLTATNAVMVYTTGMTGPEVQHAHTIISAILKFMIIVGLVSFVRGIFIIRSVAEGNGQASLMAGVTHMVGGALAVNLGPLMSAVQETLGISAFGITFS